MTIVKLRGNRMNIIALSEQYEPMFWEHVNQDILHYFFFVYDWV